MRNKNLLPRNREIALSLFLLICFTFLPSVLYSASVTVPHPTNSEECYTYDVELYGLCKSSNYDETGYIDANGYYPVFDNYVAGSPGDVCLYRAHLNWIHSDGSITEHIYYDQGYVRDNKLQSNLYDIFGDTPATSCTDPCDPVIQTLTGNPDCVNPELCSEFDSLVDAFCTAQELGYVSNCTDAGGGSYGGGTFECKDCVSLASTWATSNCHDDKYLNTFDCDTETGTCLPHDCGDLFSDCATNCENQIEYFSCLDGAQIPSVSAPCTCKDGYGIEPETAIANNSNSDSGTPSGGETDNDLLALNAGNTDAINRNINNLAGVNETGLDNISGKLDTIHNDLTQIDEQAEEDILDSSTGQSLISELGSVMDSFGDQKITDITDSITTLSDTENMQGSWFDGLLTDFTSIFSSGACTDISWTIPSLDKTITLSCDVSVKIKSLLGFLFGVYTIMSLMDLLYRGFSPKGQSNISLWGN